MSFDQFLQQQKQQRPQQQQQRPQQQQHREILNNESIERVDHNHERALIKKILSNNVIMQTMIQHMTPCSWLNIYHEVTCKKWFNKERTLNEITKRCLRQNFAIFFKNDKHAVDEITKLLEDPTYSVVGDFLLHTLQGDSVINCDLTILSKDRIYGFDQVFKWLWIILNKIGPFNQILGDGNDVNVKESLKFEFKNHYQDESMKILKVFHVPDMDSYNMCDLGFDFCKNIFSNNVLTMEYPDSVLTKQLHIYDIDDCLFGHKITNTEKLAKHVETEITKYVAIGYKFSILEAWSLESLSSELAEMIISGYYYGDVDIDDDSDAEKEVDEDEDEDKEMCAICDDDSEETTKCNNLIRFYHLGLKKAMIWNEYWKDKRALIGGFELVRREEIQCIDDTKSLDEIVMMIEEKEKMARKELNF